MGTKVKKEDLKPNEVNAAYLFLGIGGTGCEIIKRVAKRCHPAERENISFVCMDTDINDLKRIKDELPFIRTVQTSTTQTVGGFLDNDVDARKNWFPKSAVMYDKTMSEGAGQVRAISRLAVDATIKTGRIRPLYDAIDELFLKTGQEMKQAMRCIIASTSSGGTGSGMILPISMFVREYVKEKYPNASLLTRALLLLPETLDSVIKSQTERDSQARNGYATVKELNAFMMKGSGFVDLDPDLWQYRDLHVDVPVAGSEKLKSLSTLPIDFCFLMDGQDAEDSTLTTFEQYKEQAAIALYEQNIGPMQRKASSTEDNIIKELAKYRGRNRFGGIGAGILRYPYDRIVDYVACDLAMDSIGGDGEASKWTKYDKLYALYKQDQKKRGIPVGEQQSIADYYTDQLAASGQKDNFSKDLRSFYLEGLDFDAFLDAFEEYTDSVVEDLYEDEATAAKGAALNGNEKLKTDIQSIINYRDKVLEKGKDGRLKLISAIERNMESVFKNEDAKTVNVKEPYCLESLIKNKDGDVFHPCAVRYVLYELQKLMRAKADEIGSDADLRKSLDAYETRSFEYKFEKPVKGVSGLSRLHTASPSPIQKLRGYNDFVEEADRTMRGLRDAVKKFSESLAHKTAYETALIYLKAFSDEFELFYKTFEAKTNRLDRDKDDIVNELRYRKGDSVSNVCAEKDILAELSRTSLRKISQESSMLSSEVNGDIFDQIKRNAIYTMQRAVAGDDLMLENTHRDIFDDTLMGYFKNEVREKCTDINVDIINAIVLEYRLVGGLKAREAGEDFEFLASDAESYLKSKLAMGARIAAPSVQRMQNVEPREVNRCAYNVCLNENRVYRVKDLLTNSDACDTVSKYEIRFFNALYNVTPDKLKKFSAAYLTETGFKEAGNYHKAYHNYSKHIGPDSTKNAAMSTHIDKRWDNINKMPEIDDRFQKQVVLNIHKAFIYGIIHGAIQHKPMSVKANGKVVYSYMDSDDRHETLVVPNGTLCDEFYEILDALYINAKVVEDINRNIKGRKRELSRTKNCNYEKTEFFKDVANFNIFDFYAGKSAKAEPLSIEKLNERIKLIEANKKFIEKIKDLDDAGLQNLSDGEIPAQLKDVARADLKKVAGEKLMLTENETSLFAIPMVYYYSLPNSNRYISELNAMVEAVIEVFREEYTTWEKGDDVKFVLCDRLINEFNLLNRNYEKYANDKDMNIPAEIAENEVVDVIRRKIQDEIRSAPEPEDYEALLDEIAKRTAKSK